MSKRPTQTDRAAEIGVALKVLQNWRKLGVDIYDDQAITDHLRNIRKMPANVKERFLPKVNTEKVESEFDLDQLRHELNAAQDSNTARTIKTKIDGHLNLFKAEAAAGKYITRDEARDEMVRVGTVFKAAVKRLEADLPPMLDGAAPEQAQRIIGEKCDEVLRAMIEEYTKIENIGHDE